jgi:group I intron endonuclease
MIGIYCMYFEDLYGVYYIGCSSNIETRIKDHLSALDRGSHTNKKIQNAYNKYGTPVFEILETCNIDNLSQREIYYINLFDSYRSGFNLTSGGEGGGIGENNTYAKYKESDYYNVLKLLAYSEEPYSTISERTTVSIDVIKKIAMLISHTYLEIKYPEEYAIVKAKKSSRNNSAKSKGIVYPVLLDPNGKEYVVENIHKFADENGLQYQNLHKVLTGKRAHHKGWKLK